MERWVFSQFSPDGSNRYSPPRIKRRKNNLLNTAVRNLKCYCIVPQFLSCKLYSAGITFQLPPQKTLFCFRDSIFPRGTSGKVVIIVHGALLVRSAPCGLGFLMLK